MFLIILVGLGIGLIAGFVLNISYPTEYAFYITMALLAALDSLMGAARSQMEGKYNSVVFVTGFVTNAILAGALTYLGDLLGVPIYYAAIFTFGGRLFNNLAVIRHHLLERYVMRKEPKKDDNIDKK
ncbi:small basic family protein [Bacilliculturomica massiliensis]|uniref:small basic family protein n=1 Tax=Bacilliculturomica massiliensis TaxID=1917867 RepID=UPI0010327A29|nr:small basic family protein [Bacilliculturomica massiliensis]